MMVDEVPRLRPRYSRDASIPELFTRQAALTPNAIAVVDARSSLTFAELEARSNQLAHLLLARGIRPEAAVGVAFERSIELPVALLGILKAGGAYVPLDTSYPRERFAFMVADSGMTHVVTKESLCDPSLYGRADVVSVVDDAATLSAQRSDPPQVRVAAEALAYIMYTSGSTGRPKGVAVIHRGVVRLVRETNYVDVGAHDRFLHFAPLAFDASTFEIWAPLLNGARLAIAREGLLSIADLGEEIERFGVTNMFLTPSLFGRMVEERLPAFDSLRHLITGGDVVSPAHARRFLEHYPDCRLSAVYGPTENTTFSTLCDLPDADAIGTSVPIGRPIAHSTAYVVDEYMRPVATGVAGELCVGGDGVARGYVNLPALTAERFVRDPFANDPAATMYRTGDRARFRADGVLEFLGRTDHQVKVGGHRIELGEIEVALQEHAAVAAAAVVVSTLAGEKALFAFVVPSRGQRFDERRVRADLAAKLPRFMLPSRISPLERLPEHASGKVDRTALVRLAEALGAPKVRSLRLVGGSSSGDTRVALQRTIAELWQNVLGDAGTADPDVNFFDAGGDSLRLLALHVRLQAELRIELRIVDLFEHSTIRKLAAFLNARVA